MHLKRNASRDLNIYVSIFKEVNFKGYCMYIYFWKYLYTWKEFYLFVHKDHSKILYGRLLDNFFQNIVDW